MNILVDSAMPYWDELFSSLGHVETFNAGQLAFKENDIAMCSMLKAYLPRVECLLVRSTTQVNQTLLDNMPNLRVVATATAGYDHFDTDALSAANIDYYVAGGCNAQAVAQYAVCAILQLAENDRFLISQKVVGIVGNGNVGSRVAASMRALGAKVIVYDPPQQAALHIKHNEQGKQKNISEVADYVSFLDILRADIICIHAPLNSHKEHPSKHLFNENTLSRLNASQYLLNAGRGEIIDNQALYEHFEMLRQKNVPACNVVLDVWENEPAVMKALIPYLRIASAHIAGHTLEGKARGTFMLYEYLCKRINRAQKNTFSTLLPRSDLQLNTAIKDTLHATSSLDAVSVQTLVKKISQLVYDIQNEDRVFRLHMAQSATFTQLRQEYPIRREFSALSLNTSCACLRELLEGIGFTINRESITR